MTLKTHLQRASLYHYSKKSSPIKSAESMKLIIKSNFQVLSVINQFKTTVSYCEQESTIAYKYNGK